MRASKFVGLHNCDLFKKHVYSVEENVDGLRILEVGEPAERQVGLAGFVKGLVEQDGDEVELETLKISFKAYLKGIGSDFSFW